MKPTKIRNRQLYFAPIHTISKHLRSHMSKGLHEKYGLRNVRVKEGDTVRILRGEYKGIDGKVTKVSSEKSSVAIEGVKKEKLKGEKFDVYIHTSNVIIIDLNTDDRWRKKILGKKLKLASKDESPKDEHEKLEPKTEKTDDKVQKKKEKKQLSTKKKTEEKITKESKSRRKPPKTKSEQRKVKKLKKTETANG